MTATDVRPIHVPYPDTTARELRITADGCRLHIRPGAAEEWVSGTYQDPSGQRSPRFTDDGGRLQRSTQVAIAARASSVELVVPSSTPARITLAPMLSDLDVGDGFSRRNGDVYTTAAAATDRPLLTIDASVEVGRLKLRLRKEAPDHG